MNSLNHNSEARSEKIIEEFCNKWLIGLKDSITNLCFYKSFYFHCHNVAWEVIIARTCIYELRFWVRFNKWLTSTIVGLKLVVNRALLRFERIIVYAQLTVAIVGNLGALWINATYVSVNRKLRQWFYFHVPPEFRIHEGNGGGTKRSLRYTRNFVL